MLDPKFIEAIVLGIVQGVAEFLPISSSGHLVLLQKPLADLLGISSTHSENLRLNIALHFGTLLSILCVYRRDLLKLTGQRQLCIAIVVATLPVVVVGLLLKDWVETTFQTTLSVGCCLLVTAGLLRGGQLWERSERRPEITLLDAILIGGFQALAILPGISRSGSTIAGGLWRGLERDQAARFSFFIAIPAILGAVILSGWEEWQHPSTQTEWMPLAVGVGTSFIVGLLSLTWLLRLISQGRLHWFAVYCAVVGSGAILSSLFS